MDVKTAIIILSGVEDPAKGAHALLYALDLKKNGADVEVYFDGAGVNWFSTFTDPSNQFRPLFDSVQKMGLLKAACDSCVDIFNARASAEKLGVKTTDSGTHVSMGDLSKRGYRTHII